MNSDGRIALRPVEAADEEFLVAVYRSTRQAELAHVPWRPEQNDAFVRAQSLEKPSGNSSTGDEAPELLRPRAG